MSATPAGTGRRYVVADVFTERPYAGNPLAVVLDAVGLEDRAMQAIAREFGLAETSFVLPARNEGTSAHVRIFTPRIEVPFAGHPNIGTAVVLARELAARGERPATFVFEEAGGNVPLTLLRTGATVTGAELTAPGTLTLGEPVAVAAVAACLGLTPAEIVSTTHPPRVASVGLAFLVAQVRDRAALSRAQPVLEAQARTLPPLGVDAVYAWCRGEDKGELHARTFAPLDATPEDPATGSATAAAIAQLTLLEAGRDLVRRYLVHQGVDMGRPSLIRGTVEKRAGVVVAVRIAGSAVVVTEGVILAAP